LELGKGSLEDLEMNPGFWGKKSVFITGHTGFKGSWISLWLRRLGAEVTGYSLPPPTQPNLFSDSNLVKEMDSITGDVRDLPALESAVSKARPEVLIHLAAQALVRTSYTDPLDTISTNVMGTANVLDVCRRTPSLRAALIVTTDKCYEDNPAKRPYAETAPLGGKDPYSASKAAAEIVTASYRNSYFNGTQFPKSPAIATCRAGNIIGGGDWAQDRLIPDLVRAFQQKRPAPIRNPHAVRPWQFVLDALRGYLILAEKAFTIGASFAESWNFGPSSEESSKPVGWMATEFGRHFDPPIQWQTDTAKHPHEAKTLELDSSKARARLEWKTQLTIPEILQWTAEWYRDSWTTRDAKTISEKQRKP